jgi:hypothetical protein
MVNANNCDLCATFYSTKFFNGNAGVSQKCLFDEENPLEIPHQIRNFIDARGCASFTAGTPTRNKLFSVQYFDGVNVIEFGRAETAKGAKKLKTRLTTEMGIVESNITITKIVTEGVVDIDTEP